jgi:hypothetical protein
MKLYVRPTEKAEVQDMETRHCCGLQQVSETLVRSTSGTVSRLVLQVGPTGTVCVYVGMCRRQDEYRYIARTCSTCMVIEPSSVAVGLHLLVRHIYMPSANHANYCIGQGYDSCGQSCGCSMRNTSYPYLFVVAMPCKDLYVEVQMTLSRIKYMALMQ